MTTPQPARRPLYRRPDADPAQAAPDSDAQAAAPGLRRLAVELADQAGPVAGPVPPAATPGSGRRRLADPGTAR
ncbi:hypothetical protein [Kitasatospora sp. NPDC002965]|uniref:hypothetical protein n=1 Tax=Kitasatospora sp. NPDC002965 TaxID=3154775 RepID=UPI0033AA2FF3